MGCHTQYKKLITNNQDEIVKKVKDAISTSKYYDWYEFTSLDNLFENNEEWVEEIAEMVFDSIQGDLVQIDGVYNLYESANDYQTDEPRIGGYPDTIIKSAKEMFAAMETGLINWEGKHFDFYFSKDREEYIKKNIVDFFNAHPDGIIKFG